MIIPGTLILLFGVMLILMSLVEFQKRDKRFKKGVKIKRNKKASFYLFFGIVLIVVAIKFLIL